MNSIDVGYVANLARLNLSTDEVDRFQKQLGDILEYVEQLKSVDISQFEKNPLGYNIDKNNLRADAVKPSFEAKAALSNAPERTNDLFKVTKIVES